jgi:hypothetical protein
VKTFVQSDFDLALKTLQDFGLLLETDSKLPSVAGLIAGEPVRGSWWTHPRSHEIFGVLQRLADHKDVLITKLVSGKVTFVHRKLWPDILSIGSAREGWQVRGLSPSARVLLKMIDRHRESRSDRLEWPPKFKSVKPGLPIRELEKRLLIHTEEFHTESGAHAKLLETWECWAQRNSFTRKIPEVANAKQRLHEKLSVLNELFGAAAELPWTRVR